MKQETEETPVKGALIYQPQGAAGEYARWAVNLYNGCSNGCTYCYNRRGVLSHAFSDKPKLAAPIAKLRDRLLAEYRKRYNMKSDAIVPDDVVQQDTIIAARSLVWDDVKKIGKEKICKDCGIFFSFTCDPFDNESDQNILQQVVTMLIYHQVPVTILTKSVDWLNEKLWIDTLLRIAAHPDELGRYLTIGFTLTGRDDLEPHAPFNDECIEAMRKLNTEYAIKTFVSLEPITGIHDASDVLRSVYSVTLGEIRIGAQSPIKKGRYDPTEFCGLVVLLQCFARNGIRIIVKDSMYKQAKTIDGHFGKYTIRQLDELKEIVRKKQSKK